MSTQLGRTARAARLFFFGSIIATVIFLFLSQIFGVLLGYLNSLRPPEKIPVSVGFGKLPAPNFRSLKIGEGPVEYSLDTTTGALPEMSSQAPVYPIVQPVSSYLSLDRARDLAKRLNFSVTPQSLSSNVYFWEEESRSLKMNIVSENFLLDNDYTKLVVPIGEFPSTGEIEKAAVTFLQGRGLLTFGLETGKRQVTLAKIENGQIVKTEALADSSLAQIDFFRSLPTLDSETGVTSESESSSVNPEPPTTGSEPPLVTPIYGVANVQMMVFSQNKNTEPLKIKYNNWEIDVAKSETYPLKSITLAWQEVVGGNSYVSLVRERGSQSLELPGEVNLSQVSIRGVVLAYFDDESAQKYLQPIFVFSGEARDSESRIYDFVTYVNAIDPAWVE